MDICRRFIGYDTLIQKSGIFNPGDYRLVFSGAVDTSNLEALYTKFNIDHPASYTGHSLSMNDVPELYNKSGSSFYYLGSLDSKQVDFESPDQGMAHIQTIQF